MGIGVSHIHRLSSGAAAGVALLSAVMSAVLFLIVMIALGMGCAAMLVGTRGVAG